MTNCINNSISMTGIFILLLSGSGCKQSPPPTEPTKAAASSEELQPTVQPQFEIQFTDVAEDAGIRFSYQNGEASDLFAIIESLGGGVGAIDYDKDGRVDLCFAGGGELQQQQPPQGLPTVLFRNLGELQFQRVDHLSGVSAVSFYSHGISAADFNNDGYLDVLISGYRGVQLFENMGDGTFAETPPLPTPLTTTWAASTAWSDIDQDGNLDLYLANYVDWSVENNPVCVGHDAPRDVCSPRQFQALPDQLLMNQGDGTFRSNDNIADLLSGGKALGILIADFSDKGTKDLYVCNDTVPNYQFSRSTERRYEEIAAKAGTAMNERGLPDGSMGVDLIDYNLDGRPDLWISNFENESYALYRNVGPDIFMHSSQAAGVTAVGVLAVGWGTAAFDIELDGDEDVFVANGHVQRFPRNAPLAQQPFLFINESGHRFENRAHQAGQYLATAHRGRGCAVCDVNGDGRLDVAVSHVNENVAVLVNKSKTTGHWLTVQIVGVDGLRDGNGCILRVTDSTGHVQRRELVGGGSYASSREHLVHFGFPPGQPTVDLSIQQADGSITKYAEVALNQKVLAVVAHVGNETTDQPVHPLLHLPPVR